MITLTLTLEQAAIVRDCMVQSNNDYMRWRDLLRDIPEYADNKKRIIEIIDEVSNVLLPMVKDKIAESEKVTG